MDKIKREKCLIVGIELNSNNNYNDMEELVDLVIAAEGEVVGEVVQNRNSIDNRYYLGIGKLEEIARYSDELDVDTVIFNDELSGSQLKNIEDIIGKKVIDRTTLILDIFAKRALTNEGKLQVELAQLRYRLPRLIGMNSGMSRQGGGIGSKGPGEKKIEIDKRHILSRINDIEGQISKIEKVRETKRKKRIKDEIPVVSIVGYTNAGKSTLMNSLIETYYEDDKLDNKKVFVKDMLFATLDTEHRKVKLPGGRAVIFSDTVGFIKKLPTQLVKAFHSTLEELTYSEVILHLLDINDEKLELNKQTTDELIEKIAGKDIPVITVYNKIDKINDTKESNITFMSGKKDVFYISAENKTNLKELLEYIDTRLNGEKAKYKLLIPNNDYKSYYYLYENRNTSNVEYTKDGIELEAVIYKDEIYKFNDYVVK